MEVGTALQFGGAGAYSAQSTGSRATVDYDAFLRLLLAQMKNQDPTQPIESTEYIAQLATFSNVEQAVRINAKLDLVITALSLSHADRIIGRSITSEDGIISGEVTAVRVGSAGTVAVLADGRELTLGPGVTIT